MTPARKAKWRIGIAFVVLAAALAGGAYLISDLGRFQENISTKESRQALQGVSDVGQIEELSKKYTASKFLQAIAVATRAADGTTSASDKMLGDVAPPAAARDFNYGAASRAELEALRGDIRTAQANAAAFMPRYAELLKRERDSVRANALWYLKPDAANAMLDTVDKRHADDTAAMSKLLSARGEFYGAYESFVVVMIDEFGKYKVIDGQLIFPLRTSLNRYNAAAGAMVAAKKRADAADAERKAAIKSGQERWLQFVKTQ